MFILRFIIILISILIYYNINPLNIYAKTNKFHTKTNILTDTDLNNTNTDILFKLLKTAGNNPEMIIFLTNNNKQTLHLKNKISGYYYDKAIKYYDNGNLKEAMNYIQTSLMLYETTRQKKNIADCYHILGNVYFAKSNYILSAKYYLKSLDIREQINDFSGIANIYNNLGNLNFRLHNYSRAGKLYEAALDKAIFVNNKKSIASTLNNIATLYYYQNDLNKALIYFSKSLKINSQVNNKSGLSLCLNNIGSIYAQKKQYLLAINYLDSSLLINREIESHYGICQNLLGLSDLHIKSGQYNKAIKHLTQCIKISKERGYAEYLIKAYSFMHICYSKTLNFSKAYENLYYYVNLKDSIYDNTLTKTITEIEAKYQNDKAAKEIEIKNLKISKQELLINKSKNWFIITIIITLLIVIIFITSFIYIKIRQKSKIRHELLKQQEEYTRIIINSQEEERKRIAQDLHDNIGHKLTVIKLNFEKFKEILNNENHEKNNLSEFIANMLDETHKDIRMISHKMLPRALREKELNDALTDLLENTLTNTSIKYNLHNNVKNNLSENVRITIYRVLQELLNNTIKHAQSTEIYIHLVTNQNTLIMMVEDNGIGIPDDYNLKGGIGITGIKGRLNAIAGTFNIERGPRKGTNATIRIPLN